MPHHRSSTSRRTSLDTIDSIPQRSPSPSPLLPSALGAFPDSLPNSPIIAEAPPYRRDSLNSFAGSLSPTSHGAPSFRRPTVPDLAEYEGQGEEQGEIDLSPRAQATTSLRRPTVPEIDHDESASAPAQGIAQQLDMAEPSSSPRRPSEVAPDNRASSYTPSTDRSPDEVITQAAERAGTGLRIPIPDRPALYTVNSSSALLGDVSGPNTPLTPLGTDPFASGVSESSEPSSPVSHHHPEISAAANPWQQEPDPNAVEELLPAPPQIRVNSIPNTPESADIPSFTAPTFSSPFAERTSDHPGTPPRLKNMSSDGAMSGVSPTAYRKASLAPTVSSINSYPGKSNYNRDRGPSGKSTALSPTKANIAERRSQRMKNGRQHKKDRESFKPTGGQIARKPFQSTRLKGEIYKPWLEKKDPALRWARWITIASIVLGIALAGFLCYNGYAAVPSLGKVCLALDDDFSNGLDTNTWQREVRLDGYGHGSFQWTTNSDNNSFVEDGILYIVPTLTSDHIGADAVSNGYTLNLTTDGTCTSTNVSQCVAVSNSSRLTVINPVMSARLITKNTVTLKYGKVEVRAKFPTGDWLWPSIHLLPVNETYGAWPRSGEIDIVTGRGNNATYPNRGVDYAQSDLHWGPTSDLDRLWMTWGYREQRRTYYNDKWHTYGLEWNDKYLWTYIDSRVSQVISLRFNKQSFFERGNFPSTITNTTTGDVIKLVNPWLSSGNNVAPFDQPFYLVLDLAVGGIDGWFPDGEGGKPWIDNSGTAMSDFWNAKDKWWNNWPSEPTKRGFAIDSVKVWKKC